MLDERALRRPDFVAGHEVTLADGQTWVLPGVRLRCVPDDGPDGFRLLPTGMGPEYAAAYATALKAEGAAETIRTELALARLLLLRNYDLDAGQVAELIQFDYAPEPDPAADAVRREVMGLATGGTPRPKPSAAASPGT